MTTQSASATRRWLAPVLFFGFFTLTLFRGGIDLWLVVAVTALAVLGGAAFWVESRLRRPVLNYARLGLASVTLALVLIASPAAEGENPLFGAITWLVVTLMAAIWVVYFERTEPR